MSFTITTGVFCDFCSLWMEEGGPTGIKILKKEAWEKAFHFGWCKIDGNKHACPECVNKKLGVPNE